MVLCWYICVCWGRCVLPGPLVIGSWNQSTLLTHSGHYVNALIGGCLCLFIMQVSVVGRVLFVVLVDKVCIYFIINIPL